MNYDRIKNIFIDLYEELSETFDDFESDFNEAIGSERSKQEQDDITGYFEKITESKEAAECFIKEALAPYVKARARFDVSSSYHYVVAKETVASHIKIGRNPAVNYNAFIRKLATSFKIYKKDIHDLIREVNSIE